MSSGRRGPAPEPAARKRAKGNPGRRPINDETEALEAGAHGAGFDAEPSEGGGGGESVAVPTIQPPDWLNADGLVVWNRLAPRLATMRILQLLDSDTFARYCYDFGRWVKLNRRIEGEGETYVVTSNHGTYNRAHPMLVVVDRIERRLEAYESNFALNPADRQRLFAARAAAAGAGSGAAGADLFDRSEGVGGEGDKSSPPSDKASPVGFLN